MISKEMKSRIEAVESALSEIFEICTVNSRKCFATASGGVIAVAGIPKFNSLVIEYADSMEDAKKNRFEDGDMFPIDETALQPMIQSVIEEIQQNT